MRKLFSHIAVVCSALMLVSSCLSNDDDNGYVTYNDAAVTVFTLGKLNLYLHTTSSQGTDSVYKQTLDGSTCKFYIDQLNNVIYNPDSLPYGTDARHVLVTAAARNGGAIGLKSLTSDSLYYFSASDSLDFSQTRQLYVYSNDLTNYRVYEVRVNVHKEKAEGYSWSTMTATTEPFNGDLRATTLGRKLIVVNGSQTADDVVGTSRVYDIETNRWATSTQAFGSKAFSNLVGNGEKAWVLDAGQLRVTTDGLTWESKPVSTISRLVGATSANLYALAADGQLMASADEGTTWTAEDLDSDAALLPSQETAFAALPSKTNLLTTQLVLIGTRSHADYPADSYAQLWGKVEETAQNSIAQPWFYYGAGTSQGKSLPWLSPLQATRFGSGILAIGRMADGQPSPLYFSEDGGLTWYGDTLLTLPGDFNPQHGFAMAIDDSSIVWLVDGESGKTWRGRYNKFAWESDKQEN